MYEERNVDRQKNGPINQERLGVVLRSSTQRAADFLSQFRCSINADVNQMVVAYGLLDLERVSQLAHRIEGASEVVGAGPLGQACRLLKRAAQSGSASEVLLVIDSLLECKRALFACLDRHHPAVAKTRAASMDSEACAGLVFMVAEDHQFQRGVLMQLLRRLGAREVHGFADGASALRAARELRSPAIMLLDLAMPEMHGLDVIHAAAHEDLALSFIVNSAQTQDMMDWSLRIARGYGAKVLGALSKPLTAAKLTLLLAHPRDLTTTPSMPGAPAPIAQNGKPSGAGIS